MNELLNNYGKNILKILRKANKNVFFVTTVSLYSTNILTTCKLWRYSNKKILHKALLRTFYNSLGILSSKKAFVIKTGCVGCKKKK